MHSCPEHGRSLHRKVEQLGEQLVAGQWQDNEECQGAVLLSPTVVEWTEELVSVLAARPEVVRCVDGLQDKYEQMRQELNTAEQGGSEMSAVELFEMKEKIDGLVSEWSALGLSDDCGFDCLPAAWAHDARSERLGEKLAQLKTDLAIAALGVPSGQFNKLLPAFPPMEQAVTCFAREKPSCALCCESVTVQAKFCSPLHNEVICYGCFRMHAWARQHDEHRRFLEFRPFPCPFCREQFELYMPELVLHCVREPEEGRPRQRVRDSSPKRNQSSSSYEPSSEPPSHSRSQPASGVLRCCSVCGTRSGLLWIGNRWLCRKEQLGARPPIVLE